MTTGPYTDIDFVLSGSDGRGDFIGISGSALDKAGIGVFTCESGSVNFLSKSAGTMLNVYNGPYQYASWQQTRNLYNPIVRRLVENSILSLSNPSTLLIDVHGDQIKSNRDTVSCFKEPVVSGESRPLIHSVVVQPNINQPDVVTSSFTYTYDNNLSSFTNPAIRNRLGINISDAESMYVNISELYLDTLERTLDTNPVREFVALNYSQILYPSPMNAYLNRTRSRTNYAEVAGTGSDGYDRIFGHQRTFFKENEIRTFGTASNSQGYKYSDTAATLEYTASWIGSGSFDSTVFIKDATSNVVDSTGASPTLSNYCFQFGWAGDDVVVSTRFLQYANKVLNHPGTSSVTLTFELMMGNHTSKPRLNVPEAGDNLLVQYSVDGGSWNNFTSNGEITNAYSGLTNTGFDADVTASVDLATVLGDPNQSAYIRIAMDTFYGWAWDNYAIQNLKINAFDAPNPVDFLNFNPMATDGIKSFPNSSSYENRDGELMGDTDESMFGLSPQPSMAFTEQTHLANSSGSLTVEGDYVETLVRQMAGKNPWYESYEEYDTEIRNRGKGMSIVPEFRISDFMEYYWTDQGKDLRAINDKFLLLDGASITASADSESTGLDPTFFTRYVESSAPSRLYGKIASHEDIATLSRIKLSCKGIKKILPYDGFYPQSRTIQLGNLLSQSMGPHITGYKSKVPSSSYYPQALQGLLKPLVSPGILYNSIKAGIAVDYPIYTGSVPGVTTDTFLPSDFNLESAPNYRIPFEALLNLRGTLPSTILDEAQLRIAMQEGNATITDPHIRLVSSFATLDKGVNTEDIFEYSFTWDGTKSPLFELGMHNFLAETVDFFLDAGKLTSYRGTPQPEFGWQFEADKTYYMDVVLRDTVEMNKFTEYIGSVPVNPPGCFTGSFLLLDYYFNDLLIGDGMSGSLFGADVDIVMGGSGEGVYALVGAPLAAPGIEDIGGVAFLFQNKFDSAGWQQLCILTGGAYTYPYEDDAGYSVALDSSSNGLYALVGAPQYEVSGDYTGSAYLYHLTQESLQNPTPLYHGYTQYAECSAGPYACAYTQLADRFESVQKLSASVGWDGGTVNANNAFGYDVDIVATDSDGVYCLVGISLPAVGDPGAAYLYHSRSSGFDPAIDEQLLTGSTAEANDLFGRAVALDSGSSGIYCAVGCQGLSSSGGESQGAVYVYHSQSSEEFGIPQNEEILTASDASSFDWLGSAVDIVSGSDRIYVIAGSPVAQAGKGAAYIFKKSNAEPDWTNVQLLTSSHQQAGDYNFGQCVKIVSGSGGIDMLIGGRPVGDQTGSAYFFHSSSGALLEQIVSSPAPETGSNFGLSKPGLGGFHTLALASSSASGLVSVITAPSASTYSYASGGLGCLFTGTVGAMTPNPIQVFIGSDSYKQHGKLFGMSIDGTMDPAYCAYTPPYMYGESISRISFNVGALPNSYGVDEIFRMAKVENILNIETSKVAIENFATKSLTLLQDQVKMPVPSSINLFGKFYNPGVTYDAATEVATRIDKEPNLNPAWVISTKFESPVLDVSSSKYAEFYTSHNTHMTGTYDWDTGLTIGHELPQTIWSSYGDVPKGTKGVYFELKESFPQVLQDPTNTTTGSLIDICGFTIPVEGSKVGKLAQTKTISEAIVVIPYSDVEIRQAYQATPVHTSDAMPESIPTEAITVFSEAAQKHFFRIPRGNFEAQRKNLKEFGVAVPADLNPRANVAVTRTTISDMITRMGQYVIPPNLDFVRDEDIDPFVMYIFEFEHVLKQRELADIWQGVMPESAIKMVEDEIIIDHNFDVLEFFGNVADPKIFGDMKYFVFKIKRRAKYNYYKITEDATDDARFNYQFSGDPADGAIGFDVSYNWPYDFFSLVENVEVQSTITIKKKIPPAPPSDDESEGQI